MKKNEYEIMIKNYVNWGTISWRPTWNKIKNDFLKHYEMWIKINLNFNWIENVTHSFIDELIWIFIFHESARALEIFKFTNCNESVKNNIKLVIADRARNINHK